MSATLPKVQTLIRAQTALSRVELRCKATQVSYGAVALVLSLIALAMLNVAAFLGLNRVVEPAWSALILSGVDVLLAVLLVKAALRVQPGPEAELAKEVRDIVLAELTAEAESVRGEIEQVRIDVQKIRSGFSGLAGGLSIVELLTKTLARSRSKKARS